MKIAIENTFRRSVASGVMIGLFSLACFSQSLLKNKDVIELVRAGLDADIVVEKINASDTDFDTSTDALIKLTEATVPKAVITAMIKKHKEQTNSQKTIASNENHLLALVPEQGKLADLKKLKTFYVSTGDSKALERIIKEVTKVGFKAVDAIENADFCLTYKEWEEPVRGSQYLNKIGTLDVFTISDRLSNRIRNIYNTRKEKFYVFTAEPAEAVAKQFVKDFKSN